MKAITDPPDPNPPGYTHVAYVAGPYRARTKRGVAKNIRAARAVAIDLWGIGLIALCPHLNTALFDGLCPDAVWLAGDLELLRRSDLVVLVPGWEASRGTRAEVEEARRIQQPIYRWPQDMGVLRAIGEGVHDGSIA